MTDPILERRAQISRLNSLALKLGLGLYGLASVLFAVALATEFSRSLTDAITLALIVGSVILAPAMVIHYAIKAADRADRENSW
jgi:urea transporter